MREHPHRPPLQVFISSKTALEEKDFLTYGISTYLIKPYDYETFLRAIRQMLESRDQYFQKPLPLSQLFLIKQPGGLQRVKINFYTIAYLQADGMDCKIWLSDSFYLTANKPMATVLSRLPAEDFKQCHRSFSVNVNYISYVEHSKVYLVGIPEAIPVGDRKIHVEFDLWDKTNSL